MTLGQAVEFLDRMGTTGLSKQALQESIKKALDGKRKGKFAGIKFTKILKN